MDDHLKFLLVGAGGMGTLHAKNLQSLGCRLISVVDTDIAKAENLASQLGSLRWSPDYEEEVKRDAEG